MPSRHTPREEQSALGILTEMAVEGTSALIEAQRALLTLVQQENDIFLNGIKERLGSFLPGVAMTDLVRRSLDTFVGMQEELLTATSKQSMEWLEATQSGKKPDPARLLEFARETLETFARAQKHFLEAVEQESSKAVDTHHRHEGKPAKKTEMAHLARASAEAFIEAQKRLLDIVHQQVNVNLDLTTRSLEMMNPSQLLPVANRTGQQVKEFFDSEASLIGSLVKPQAKKKAHPAKHARKGTKQSDLVTA